MPRIRFGTGRLMLAVAIAGIGLGGAAIVAKNAPLAGETPADRFARVIVTAPSIALAAFGLAITVLAAGDRLAGVCRGFRSGRFETVEPPTQ